MAQIAKCQHPQIGQAISQYGPPIYCLACNASINEDLDLEPILGVPMTTTERTCRHLEIVDLLEQYGEATCPECGRQVFVDPPARSPQRVELNPIALTLALLGAAVIVVGLFLPANENPGFGGVQGNTLIQQGLIVWSVVIFGTLFALGLARAYQKHRAFSWFALVFPISVAATSAHLLKGSTLYPLVNGRADASAVGTHAAAGVGVYAVMVGAAICALGIVALVLWSEANSNPRVNP